MREIISLFLLLMPLYIHAQKVEIAIGEGWAEIPVLQTQSELKSGWKIVDYQMKSRLTHYMMGTHATQMVDERPVFRVTPGEKEVLVDYAIIYLKSYKHYRKIPKAKLSDNEYTRLEPSDFDIRAVEDAFVCQPRRQLEPGEYILVNLAQEPIGELDDLLVFPFCIMK